MTLTILDLGFGLFGDHSRGRAAQEPGWPGAGQETANRLSPWLGRRCNGMRLGWVCRRAVATKTENLS